MIEKNRINRIITYQLIVNFSHADDKDLVAVIMMRIKSSFFSVVRYLFIKSTISRLHNNNKQQSNLLLILGTIERK